MSAGNLMGAIPGVGGFIGVLNSSKNGDRYAKQMKELLNYYKGLDADATAAGAVPLESKLATTVADQGSIDAQHQALQYLQNLQDQGMNLEDRAALNNVRLQQESTEQAQRNAILQQAAARGGLNSSSTLGAQLIGRQQSSNQAANDALNIGAEAQRRKLQAAMGAGNLGSQMRGQSFQEASTRGGAADAAAQFNKGLLQQTFANKMGLQGARAGLAGGAAQAKYKTNQDQIAQAEALRRDNDEKAMKFMSMGMGG